MKDARFLNTYGMHFINYFPHRERGLTYFLLSQYREALTDLKLSIQSEPSDKAYFYLDKTREHLTESTKALPDVEDGIVLDKPFHTQKIISTKKNKLFISGKIYDKKYVSSLYINNQSLYINRSKKEISFKKQLNLKNGKNQITIEVHNLSGQKYTTERAVFVDNSGPLIVIHPESSDKIIKGTLIDDSPIQMFTINDKTINLTSDHNFSITTNQAKIILKAMDTLGNITIAKYSPFTLKNEKLQLVQNNYLETMDDCFVIAKNSRPHSIKITLKGISNGDRVFQDYIKLDGFIRSAKEISLFYITVTKHNEQTIFTKKKHIYNTCQQLHFSEDITLFEGINIVSITAKNFSGNIKKKIISIEYEKPNIYQLRNRYRIKILPLDIYDLQKEFNIANQPEIIQIKNDNNQLSHSKRNIFINHLIKNINQQKRFQVICPDALINDLDIIRNNQIDKIKTQFPHALLITDSWEDRHGIEISTRLVDIDTSTIMTYQNANKQSSIFDAYTDRTNKKMLYSLSKRLAEKICHEFPLENGKIVSKNKSSIVVLLNQNHLGWPVLIYYKKKKRNPETGHSFGAEHIILDDSARLNYRLKTGYEILTQCHTMVNKNIEVFTK